MNSNAAELCLRTRSPFGVQGAGFTADRAGSSSPTLNVD